MAVTSQVRERMEVIASDGVRIGLVDHLDGTDRIKLTRESGGHGHHHIIPTTWIDHVDAHVHLNQTSDYVARNWQHGH